MSVALFVSVIELGLLLIYPYITYGFVDDSLVYSVPEYIALCLSSNMGKLADNLESNLGLGSSAAKAFAYLPLIIVVVALICAVLSLFLSLAKKSKGAGVMQLIGGGAGIVMNVLLSLSLTAGEDAANVPARLIITPELTVLLVLMTAFGIFNIVKPDSALGSKTAPVMPAAPGRTYPQVNAQPPMRQPVYNAPPAAPAPTPAPAVQPAAPAVSAVPTAPSAASGTYTCPVCGTTQKSELAFCTFCGNPNPNKQ